MPREKTGQKAVSVYLDDDTHRGLKALAALTDKPLGDLIADVMVEWWAANPHRTSIEAVHQQTKKPPAAPAKTRRS